MFYNKVLFKQAGLDPEKPPTTVKEMVDAARKINALGGGVKGFYFGGNCGGCQLFTTWPMIWASGGTVLNDDGTQSTVDNPQAAQVYCLCRQMYTDGIVGAVQERAGPTWTAPFSSGKIGIQPEGATILGTIKENRTCRSASRRSPAWTAASPRSSAVTCSALGQEQARLRGVELHRLDAVRRGPGRTSPPRQATSPRAATWPTTSTPRRIRGW